MADRVTFDFETGEIIFDTDAQKGVEVDLHLKEKRAAIMAAAGYDQVSVVDLCKEINDALRGMGFSGNITAGADPEQGN